MTGMHDGQRTRITQQSTPGQPQRVELEIAGMMAQCRPVDGNLNATASHLASAGILLSRLTSETVVFPTRELPQILGLLSTVVDVVPVGPARVLMELLRNPPLEDEPVKLTIDGTRTVNLAWRSSGVEFNEHLDFTMVTALMTLGTPIIGSEQSWEKLSKHAHVPLAPIRARLNYDGFVELACANPARVEQAGIPGLFRLGPALFGAAHAHADIVAALPGVIWDSPLPAYDTATRPLSAVPFALSEHAAADLQGIVDRLAARRAQVIAWAPGLGRRVFALAAIEALNAYPLLIVAAPRALLAWQRTLEMAGRSWSMANHEALTDVRLLTYRDLAGKTRVVSPTAILFDSFDEVTRRSPALARSVHRLDGLVDSYRVAVCTALPVQADALAQFMSAVRPSEFRSDIPPAIRYPGTSALRLREHAEVYASHRNSDDKLPEFRRSRVEELDCPDGLAEGIESVINDLGRGQATVLVTRLALESGIGSVISPKLVRAADLMTRWVKTGERAAALVRNEETARLLSLLLQPVATQTTTDGQPAAGSAVIGWGKWPDVTSYDRVVVLDYPDSLNELTSAVGKASGLAGPKELVMLHVRETLDDRAVVLAMLTAEGVVVRDPVSHLLG